MTSSSGRKRSVVGRVVELLGDDLPAQLQQQARSFFDLGRSGQDGAVVILQQLEPMLDVARVAVEMRDRQPQLGAQHGAGEFGDEFLGGVGRCAEAILEIASQAAGMARRSEEHTSELQSLMRISYAVFCLKKKKHKKKQ